MQSRHLENGLRTRMRLDVGLMLLGLLPMLPWAWIAVGLAIEALPWPQGYYGPHAIDGPGVYDGPVHPEFFIWAWLIIGAMIVSIVLYAIWVVRLAVQRESPADRNGWAFLTILFRLGAVIAALWIINFLLAEQFWIMYEPW